MERIVGGRNATIEEFPWQVSLFNKTDGDHFCGASIIGRLTILTAAHCIRSNRPVGVRAGTTFHAKGGYIHEVKRIIVHPDYNREEGKNDIALVILKYPLIYGSRVQPVHLPEFSYDLGNNESVWITGWGYSNSTNDNEDGIPDNLQAAQVRIVDQDACIYAYRDISRAITDNMFCAGIENVGGTDTCQVLNGSTN